MSTDEADGVFATTVRAFCASLVLVVVVVVAVHVFVVQFRMATGDDGFLSHVCNSGDGESHTGWGERFEHPTKTWACATHSCKQFTMQAVAVAIAKATWAWVRGKC